MRRIITGLLILAMVMTVPMPVHADPPAPFAGSGTIADPCLITSAEDLQKLAGLVNDGSTAYAAAGVYYELTQDINLSVYGQSYNSGKGWIPIGVGDALNPFNGNFDGDGHKITGLYINDLIANAGLFGIVSASATVEKVTLNGAQIEAINNVGGIAGEVKGTVTDCAYLSLANGTDLVTNTMNSVGGIAGYVDNGGTVKYCYSTGRVGGVSYIGGVAGTVDGTVHDCYSTSYVSGGNHIGGVAGQVNGTVENCYSTGIIGGMSFVGGITGMSFGTVQHCAALNLYVNANNNHAGRVVGCMNGGTLSDNMAFGGMNIAENGSVKDISATAHHNDVDGETRIAGVLQTSNSFPTAMTQSPWVYESGKLPGLGESINMPSYLSPPEITTTSLPDGTAGTTYTASLSASGGSGVYTDWTASGLPDGLRLTITGKILGVPEDDGDYDVSITVRDSNHATSTKNIALHIDSSSPGLLNIWHEMSEPESLANIPVQDVAYGQNAFVGVGDEGAIMISDNGVEWTSEVSGTDADRTYRGIAFGGGTFVAVGQDHSTGMISTKTGSGGWATQISTGGFLECAAYAGNGTFIAGGENKVLISTDCGATWSPVDLGGLDAAITFVLHGIAADENGHAVAVGEASSGHSILWYSEDCGNSWSATASLIEDTSLNSVAYGNDTFVAVGKDGSAYHSGDYGATWNYAELPGAQDPFTPVMNKVTFGSNTFVAVGECEEDQYNVISSSDNGASWTERMTDPDISFQTAAYGNNSFVCAGLTLPGSLGKLYQSNPLIPLSITTASLADGTAGTAYTASLSASGGIAPYTWSAVTLPGGLSIDSASGIISGTPTVACTSSIAITVQDAQAHLADKTLILTIAPAAAGPDPNPPGGGGGGGGKETKPQQTPPAQMLNSEGKPLESVIGTLDNGTGAVSLELSSDLLDKVFDQSKTNENGINNIEIVIPEISGAKAYEPTLPIAALASEKPGRTIEFKTEIASVTVPQNMLANADVPEAKKASLSISLADTSELDTSLREMIGSRPVVELSLKIDGRQTSWSNENAPVSVSVPYTPTKEELNDPEHIVVWYVDGSGNAIPVPDGHYDPVTGTVTFTTTHFSCYAVGYAAASFKDVPSNAWYYKAVGFLAARNITTGAGNGDFRPNAKLTRGEFLVMVMRAYGMTPDGNPKDNFKDAGSSYYTGYLAAAKRLGISDGVGNNMFAPNREITRQEMGTLLYNILKDVNRLPQSNPGSTAAKVSLSDFADSAGISSWAADAMALMAETGIINGSNGKLKPASTTTRAEMAQVMYNLLSK